MNINKAFLALAIGFALAACTDKPASKPQPMPKTIAQERGEVTSGLERNIERFSKPDEYGVVCYQSRWSSDNLACVKVK